MHHVPLKAHRAESLIESVISVSVIVIATMAAMSLIRTSLVGNNVIGEKIIALNLGLEGIEAVRNIRDSNYLKFPTDPANCWNTLESELVVDCPYEAKIAEGVTYTLTRNLAVTPLFDWNMEILDPLTDEGWMDLYSYSLDLDGLPGNEEIFLYAQTGETAAGLTSLEPMSFKRSLEVTYQGPDAFDATVTVEWNVRGVNKTLSLTRTIANIH